MPKSHLIEVSGLTILIVSLITGLLVSVLVAQEKKANPTGKETSQSKPGELITKIYNVPPTFVQSNEGAVADPFAPEDPFANPKRKVRTAREVLEKAGISFPPGSSAIYHPAAHRLIVRNTPDQLELVEMYIQPLGPDRLQQINVILEFIEVDSGLYHGWMFQNRITTNGNKLREAVQDWVKAGQGSIIETTLIKARSGNRAKSESIREFIYPNEFDPPEIPNEVNLDGPETKAPRTACSATAFEVRNLGTTVEVDPIIGADNVTIDINLAPEIVQENGYTHWPEQGDPFFTISMPQFYTMKTTTQVTATAGRYTILGTHRPLKASDPNRKNPIVLQFLRADISTLPIR